MGIGTQEIILIVIVVIVLFGSTKIPELARSLGKATGEFKKGQKEVERELSDAEKSVKETPVDKSSKIKLMAHDLGISTEGKTDEQLLEEIQKKMPKVKSDT
ncbi:Sec-independent protein translocase protein TatAt [uncultured archaeon]|nr:Sec-independent protein translocase protein TatAt [uncultured archaeon]